MSSLMLAACMVAMHMGSWQGAAGQSCSIADQKDLCATEVNQKDEQLSKAQVQTPSVTPCDMTVHHACTIGAIGEKGLHASPCFLTTL